MVKMKSFAFVVYCGRNYRIAVLKTSTYLAQCTAGLCECSNNHIELLYFHPRKTSYLAPHRYVGVSLTYAYHNLTQSCRNQQHNSTIHHSSYLTLIVTNRTPPTLS